MISSKKVVEGYLDKTNWKVAENSNAPFSFGSLNRHIVGEVSKDYWLTEVYDEKIKDAHRSGAIHIHDLGGLTLYCCGFSVQAIIAKGVTGVPNVAASAPAKHFMSICNQLANLATIYQNEIMGAVAFSSIDTLLAPFVKVDKLDFYKVKQNIQNLVFSLNSNSRGGAEPAFTNFTFDLTPPRDLLNKKAIVGAKEQSFTYADCQTEMDMINKAFCEVMLAGDANGDPFAYPIPTYNIHERFDWDNPNNDVLWEMTGKFGYPYFGNFLNSDMDVEDVRSMCCRLRLDLREIRKKTGGLFGSDDFTGSIGVVTIGMPRLGYLAQDEDQLFMLVEHYMDICKESLEIKRGYLQEMVIDRDLVHAFNEYVGTIDNHFSTIGILGLNEMCENFLGKNILDPEATELSERLLHHMLNRVQRYQEETGHLYNLEATPAESTCHRLALKDKAQFPDIITQGEGDNVYYTNSCRVPVQLCHDIDEIVGHQEKLQTIFNGGTAEHLYLGQSISGDKAKHIVKHCLTNYKLPYLSLSPLTKSCPEHGHIMTASKSDRCPICAKKLKMRQRVTGYVRVVDYFNPGKAQEFNDRAQYGMGSINNLKGADGDEWS